MKRNLIYSIIALVFITGCRKEDNPKFPDGLSKAPIMQLAKDSSGDASISSADPDGFTGAVIVDQYFKNDASAKSFNLVIIKNGDNSTVVTIQTDITSLPAIVTFTGAQIASLFGEAIAPGDFYDVGADAILQNGTKVQAFPVYAPPYDPAVNTLPNIGPFTVRYLVFCPFDGANYDGDFVVVVDEWQDYQPGDIVPVTSMDATHFSFMYNANDAQPIIVEVDAATNTTFVERQYYGNYGPDFGDFYCETVDGDPNSYVDPCSTSFSLVLNHSSTTLGDFGNYRIELRKQ